MVSSLSSARIPYGQNLEQTAKVVRKSQSAQELLTANFHEATVTDDWSKSKGQMWTFYSSVAASTESAANEKVLAKFGKDLMRADCINDCQKTLASSAIVNSFVFGGALGAAIASVCLQTATNEVDPVSPEAQEAVYTKGLQVVGQVSDKSHETARAQLGLQLIKSSPGAKRAAEIGNAILSEIRHSSTVPLDKTEALAMLNSNLFLDEPPVHDAIFGAIGAQTEVSQVESNFVRLVQDIRGQNLSDRDKDLVDDVALLFLSGAPSFGSRLNENKPLEYNVASFALDLDGRLTSPAQRQVFRNCLQEISTNPLTSESERLNAQETLVKESHLGEKDANTLLKWHFNAIRNQRP